MYIEATNRRRQTRQDETKRRRTKTQRQQRNGQEAAAGTEVGQRTLRRRHGMNPNAMGGAHAARMKATWCVPNGAGGLFCANMSMSDESVATICVADEKSWKNRIRHTIRVKLGIGVSVNPASYVEAAARSRHRMSAPYHAGKMGEDEEMEMGGARAETALTIYGGRSPNDLFEHFPLRRPRKLKLGLYRRGGVV